MLLHAWVLLAVCASLAFLYILWKHHPSYGANPGPPAFPVVGCVPFILLNKHRFYEWTCELFDRTPSLTLRFMFGPSVGLSTIDPQVVHHILKSNFSSYPKGPSFYPYFADLLGRGILNCDGSLWRFQRKVASHVFTSNSLRDFAVSIINAEIADRMLPALEAAQRLSDDTVDFQALMLQFTFDVICQITFGADPACLEISQLRTARADRSSASDDGPGHSGIHGELDDGDGLQGENQTPRRTSYAKVPDSLIQGFVQGLQAALQIVAERFLVPEFAWKMKKSLKIGSEKRLVEALEAVNKFTAFAIEQSKREVSSGKDRKDLLARFIRLSEESPAAFGGPVDDKNTCSGVEQEELGISDSFLRDILLSFIIAGRETVASGVTFVMWLLCLHPRVESLVLREIREIVEGRTSNRAGKGDGNKVATFTYEEVRKMNYLQAVLSESMRLYPPVASDCKYAAEDDILPDGTQVRKGYRLAYEVFAMGRSARLWGEDCLKFWPERWLDKNGMFEPVSPFKYPVFQAGPRICLGKDFAFIQMKMVVASLVQDFEFAVQPGFKPRLSYGVNMFMANGLPLTVKRRSALLG